MSFFRNNLRKDIRLGLIGQWKFDEDSGLIAFDSSGKGKHGTLNGPIRVAGKIGKTLSFDGSDDYVNVGDTTILGGLSALSVSFWMKLNTLNTNRAIISKWGSSSANQTFLIAVDSTASDEIILALHGGSFNYQIKTTTDANLVSGQWYHMTLTFTNSTDLRFYVNGVQKTLSTTQNDSVASLNNSNTSIQIGYETNESRLPINGSIDDVRIYNRALSASEVSELYNLSLSKVK